MTTTIQLRPIKKEDNPAIAQIIRTVMTEFECVGEGYSIEDSEVDTMCEAYDSPRHAYLVLEKEGKVVGGGGISPLDGGEAKTCELKKMYFSSEARGQGMGKKLVATLLERAKKLGYQKCYLETVERMESANILYQKMGFEKLQGAMGDTGHCSCDSHYVREL